MLEDLKQVLVRSHSRLLSDALGVLSIAVMLMVGLHLPGMF